MRGRPATFRAAHTVNHDPKRFGFFALLETQIRLAFYQHKDGVHHARVTYGEDQLVAGLQLI